MSSNRCSLCPRHCEADRTLGEGFCGADQRIEVASVCLHRGEEPPLNPIVNVFFAHCNLQCIYCQNWQISGRRTANSPYWEVMDAEGLADRIAPLLPQSGGLLGFVSAAHYADRLPAVVEALRARGLAPTVVYNSGGYESLSTLRSLEGIVDIYLPDLKYMDSRLAAAYSHAPDYPTVATLAIEEMARQVGQGLKIDTATGLAYRGLIVRHLVLPNATANSEQCLRWLADHFQPWVLHLSLMSQYFPPQPDLPAPLNRPLIPNEYAEVKAIAEQLGFDHGWMQELNAANCYRPDFASPIHPFEATNPSNI